MNPLFLLAAAAATAGAIYFFTQNASAAPAPAAPPNVIYFRTMADEARLQQKFSQYGGRVVIGGYRDMLQSVVYRVAREHPNVLFVFVSANLADVTDGFLETCATDDAMVIGTGHISGGAPVRDETPSQCVPRGNSELQYTILSEAAAS